MLLDTEARAAYDAMRRARWDDVGQVDRRHSAWRSQAGPVRRAPSRVSEAPRPTEGRRSDRQTVFLLVLVVPLLGALLFYVVDAVQVAGRASRASASDLALAPLSRASAEGAARSAFVLVAGQKPNPQAAASANRAIRSYVDGPPEGEILRSIGRRLVQAAASDDVQAWSQAVSELCVMAGTCQSPAHGH